MKIKIRNKAVFTDRVTPLEEANKEISYRAALEGIVLLENDGTLPLVPGKIALYGAGAAGGTGGTDRAGPAGTAAGQSSAHSDRLLCGQQAGGRRLGDAPGD